MEKNQSTLTEERGAVELFLHYLSIILRYKIFIMVITTVAAISVVTFSIISIKLPPERSPLPNTYRSDAKLIFQSNNDAGGMSSMLSMFGVDASMAGSIKDPSQMALQVLQSRPFLDSVSEHLNLPNRFGIEKNNKSLLRSIIYSGSRYIYDQSTGTFSISFTSTDPEFATEVVTAEVELLGEWFQKEGISMRSSQLQMLEDKLSELSIEISKIESEIETFQIEHGVLDIEQLAQTQAALLLDLRTRLNQIELEIGEYSEYSTIEDPALVRLNAQKSNIINQIRRIERGYISSDGRKMPSTEELPQLSLQFAHMTTDLELQMQLYKTLSERYEVTKLAAAEEGVFSILEPAEVPTEKVGPSRGRLCMMVTAGAFFGSIVLALLINMLLSVIKDPDKMKRMNKVNF